VIRNKRKLNLFFHMNMLPRLLLLCSLVAAAPGQAPAKEITGKGADVADPQKSDPRTMAFPPLKFQLPKAERVQLDNGMIVYLLQDHELPIVNITAYLDTGSVYEPPEKVGLASVTGAALREGGTRKTPADRLDRELEFMASSIESVISADHATVSMSSLTRNLDRTLALYSEVLMQPAFDPGRVELALSHAVEAIRRQNDDPKGVAGRELAKAIYAGHPLGQVPTVATIRAIGVKDLVAFHDRYFFPSNTILAVSGDFDREKLLKSLKTTFAGWQNKKKDFPVVPVPKQDPKPEVLHVQKDVNQSVIRMGHLGIDKNNPDLYAIKVMDYILGGGFTSRLTQEIRSNQGLAYNVDSYFETGRRFPAPFVAETETKSETTARTIDLLRSIITGMTQADVSDRELKLAKDAIINSFIFGFERSDVVVNQRARLEFYHFPEGYLENYRDNIAKVTKADVLRVARKYLQPEAMKLVVVGNTTKFDKPLTVFGSVREIKLENEKTAGK
jgi:zinc protease